MNNASHNVRKKANRKKFNFIDFLVVLIILAAVAALIYLFSPWSKIEKLWNNDEVELTYFIEIKDVPPEYIDHIKSGDTVLDSVTKNSLGKISDVSYKASYVYEYTTDDNGKVICSQVNSPTQKDGNVPETIVIKITAAADHKKGTGYTVNGSRVAVGELFDLRLPTYTCSGYCIQMYE